MLKNDLFAIVLTQLEKGKEERAREVLSGLQKMVYIRLEDTGPGSHE